MQSRIQQVKFKAGLPSEIEVIPIAETVSRHRSSISMPHRADFYSIFWIQRGTAEYLVDFEPVQVKANSFLFVNKDRVKALDQKSEHDGKILLFTDDFFARSEEDTRYLHSTILFNDFHGIPVTKIEATPSLQTIFREIEAELTGESDTLQPPIVHSLLRGLLLMAERESRKQGFVEMGKGADFDYTVLFRDLLEMNFKVMKSVGGFAEKLHVSEKRLTTATTKTLGKSPKIIIDERVMLEAKRILLHTNLSIKEVGFDLGFEDPTYFIKYFRKHTGKTPIEFREGYFNS